MSTQEAAAIGLTHGGSEDTGLGNRGPASKSIVVPYGFWLFVLSDMVLFSALFATYASLAGATDGVNTNLFDGRMTTLPVFIFSQYASATPVGYQRAWGGALVLIALVMVLNLVARIIGRIFAPAKGH